MVDDEFIDFSDEREGIIDDTLDTLRDQRDEAQEVSLHGSYEIHLHMFKTGNYAVLGPIRFETSFKIEPDITFGIKQGFINQADMITSGATASNYEPLILAPIAHGFTTNSGLVDGFFIGLYALTQYNSALHANQKYKVSWRADGTASVYLDTQAEDRWTESYEEAEPDFLVEDAGTEYIDDGPEE